MGQSPEDTNHLHQMDAFSGHALRAIHSSDFWKLSDACVSVLENTASNFSTIAPPNVGNSVRRNLLLCFIFFSIIESQAIIIIISGLWKTHAF